MNGSASTPSPSGSAARTTCRRKLCGLRLGWSDILRSRLGVRSLGITSPNGKPSARRRRPPVPYSRRQSLTFIPDGIGLRKRPQGS